MHDTSRGSRGVHHHFGPTISPFPGRAWRSSAAPDRRAILETNHLQRDERTDLLVNLWFYCRDVYYCTRCRGYQPHSTIWTIAPAPFGRQQSRLRADRYPGSSHRDKPDQQRANGCSSHFCPTWRTTHYTDRKST